MKLTFTLQTIVAVFLVSSAMPLRADQEQDSIAVLQSSAAAEQKWAACQRLKTIGTTKSVPALAALLTDPQLSQAARHVLESLPYPEVDIALGEALGKTSGLVKAGIIDSMGWRARQNSVALLKPLLSDADPSIAEAASAALGRIGGPQSIEALMSARDKSRGTFQIAVLESLLKCAEQYVANHNAAAAVVVYHDLFSTAYPEQIRMAAWRGLALYDSEHRMDITLKGLSGTDKPVQKAALKVVRERADRPLLQACAAQWDKLPPDSQLAVLDAQVKLGPEALPLVKRASQSNEERLRVAAWEAVAQLNDLTFIPALVRAAAQGDATERDAARDGLERLRGPGVTEALLKELDNASSPEKTEILRAFGERGDPAAAGVLLKNAVANEQSVRLASLEALSRLAPPEAAPELLNLAAQSKSDAERGPVLKALLEVCEASPNKDQTSRQLVGALDHFSAQQKGPLLPILSELATPEALVAAQTASHDPNPELAREAIAVLSEWPNASPAKGLLDMAKSGGNSTLQVLALRGAIQVSGQEPDLSKRLNLVEQAMASATRSDEKKQALGQLGQIPTPQALNVALKDVNESDLGQEASLAALAIAEKLAPTRPDLAEEVANKLGTQAAGGDIARRAWALRHKPNVQAPFIRNWLVSGPYRQNGAIGATALFDIAFGPEKSNAKSDWKPVPPSDHINLGTLLPGQENCAAYLRTQIIAPQDCRGLLLMGSDDGVKAWLNGKVIHSNNVDRGEIIDQDIAPIELAKGTNELMLKITQGGGGWSACARIVGPDFKPIPGLRAECR